MQDLIITEHAKCRSQQRGIPRRVISSLFQYGEEMSVKGASSYFFTRKALREAGCLLSRAEVTELERFTNAYIIVGEERRVITAARMRRGRQKKRHR